MIQKQVDPEVLAKFDAELNSMIYALENSLPQLALQHQKLNGMLRTFPELTHMLTDEQIHNLMRGVIKEANVQFVIAKPKAKKLDLSALKNTAFDASQIMI